ncbi:PLP-dependent aminotransferase family protein [Rummeliibacillus sp. POC4]|uniref:aminotransferase-like domain-containing protein n=1 Tax=Rummeliibacillus sp. POC4 TaxID=2305899 RepID=UPI000E66EA12|nr:PLP-dependent aminotransferase family protein [Rummeliibacillus sp. POC4]RIJ68841.1 PLP-dependent aminotransferase family protein [Rummeliibacillus sp. POC4]
MVQIFSDRMLKTDSSFIAEVMRLTEAKDIISFAGGLPNPISFPIAEFQESMNRVLQTSGEKVFQYSGTQGYLPLRQWIADRYKKRFDMDVTADDILITTGSQQGLDLMGKVLINQGDKVAVESPCYLAAIQTFSLFEPQFLPISLEDDGLNLEELEETLKNDDVKLLYMVPNFQNPTGLTYSKEKREAIYEIIKRTNTILIEDDPYGELRFEGESLPYIAGGKSDNSVLFGSFSKTLSPGMRVGYLCTTNKELMGHLIAAKQASDLHTNVISQYAIYDYLANNDYEKHISQITELYKKQCNAMISAMEKYLPAHVTFTKPEGGMFLWVDLGEGVSSVEVFNRAVKNKVAFVPGDPFYTNVKGASTLRLNYTNSEPETIEEGIRRLAEVL